MPVLKLKDTAIAFEVSGRGPRVVMIQGVGLGGCGWLPQVEELKARYEILTFDNRGISGSLAKSSPVTIEQMAKDTSELMNHIGWESAHIVGHSMGGLIAQQLAVDIPQKVKSLALLCTFSQGKEGLGLTPRMLWIGARTKIGTAAMRRAAFLEILYAPQELEHLNRVDAAASLMPVFGHDLGEQPAIAMRQIGAMSRHNLFSRLNELKSIRTIVLSGRHDPLALPKYGRRLAEQISGSKYIEFDAAHGAPITHKKAVNTLLDKHFGAIEK